jgi:S1-C subfamily serine protease
VLSLVGFTGFDWVDYLVILLALLAAYRGLRTGAAVQTLAYAGFWLGLVVGAAIAPLAVGTGHDSATTAIISLVVMFGLAAVLGSVGRAVGSFVGKGIRRIHLGALDSLLGVVVGVAATLFACWVAGTILAQGPSSTLSRGIQNSGILRGLDRAFSPPPGVFRRIQSFVNTSGLPRVFNNLAPLPSGPVGLPSSPQVSSAVAHAKASMVKVYGRGCGQIQEGSGFVVAPGLVVTNAHVVAGIPHPVVLGVNGASHPAQAIYFNPNFDLAVLRAPGLSEPALHIDSSAVPRGTKAAVLGYPEGGPFSATGAGVTNLIRAQGPNIYGNGNTLRLVYELQAVVRPGNSGGPLVEPNGQVIGVVFSKSVSNPDIGYALASPGVATRGASAEAHAKPAGTGHCAG